MAHLHGSVLLSGCAYGAGDEAAGFGTLVWLASGDVIRFFGGANGDGDRARLHDRVRGSRYPVISAAETWTD